MKTLAVRNVTDQFYLFMHVSYISVKHEDMQT